MRGAATAGGAVPSGGGGVGARGVVGGGGGGEGVSMQRGDWPALQERVCGGGWMGQGR